jgi:hypothetical protein
MLSRFLRNTFKIPNTPSSLPMRIFSDNPESEYCWEDHDRDSKLKYPVRFFLSKTLPNLLVHRVERPISDIGYWIRSHTKDRYHILNLKAPRQGYRWGYCDTDHLIFVASFKLLADFVEIQFDHVGWEWNEGHKAAAEEIRSLYRWWTDEYPILVEGADDLKDLEDRQLIRLINIRQYLWT